MHRNENQDSVKNAISGVMVIDKPVGLTSHDVVNIVRYGTGIRRAGHTGTLDPRASGVLVILVGPAVRLSEFISASDKRYQAIIRLGAATDTFDADGRFTRLPIENMDVTESEFEQALASFTGEITQTPPPYSAIKIKGRRAYDMARKGETVEIQPRQITVHNLELLEWAPPEVVVDIHCSSGTYVRSLANDVGEQLGVGGYLVGLRRTKSGRFSLREAIPLRKLQEAFKDGSWYQYIIPAAEALSEWPSIELQPEQVDAISHGHRIPADPAVVPGPRNLARGVSMAGELVALMELDTTTSEWQPKKVFLA